jgi:transposase
VKSAARKSPIVDGKLPPVSGEEYATLKARFDEMVILCKGLSKDKNLLEARLKEALFGRKKSEKWDPNQGLLPIGDLVQSAPESTPADDGSNENQDDSTNDDASNEPKKKRKHKGRNAISPLLERRDKKREMTVEELDRLYGPGNWTAIGQETTETLDSTPSSLFVVRNIRIRYGSVDHLSPPVIASAGAVFPKCKACAGLLARIATSKYSDGLPLYRQSSIFKREGVEISRSTMTGWMEQCANLLLPIADALRDRIVKSGFVTADETPIVVLDRSHKNNKFNGYLWGYMGRDGDVYYDFRNSRSRDGPDEILAELIGILQSDGYVAYGSFAKDNIAVTLAGCWAHVRRGFHQCAAAYPLECTEALGIIRQIYKI